MQSRLRKPRKSFDNYGNAIEKQLNDDFQVYQYLNLNNIEGQNIDDYTKLINTLLVQKNKKKKTLQSLQVNFQQMTSDNVEKSLQSSKIQTWGGAKQLFTTEYEQIQIQTSNQFQVKNNLWKQIVETKKSLNLLKGDIGHLVSRNESAKLLQSKMSKAKIVADDQYKRVSMAFIKDKQQIKLRSEMQKKFNKKLNNVSMYEDTTLLKYKRNYLDSMIKKKDIFDRLNYIEKVSASINQSGDLQKQKNIKNIKSLQLFQSLLKTSKLIQEIPKVQNGLTYTAQSIHKFSCWLKNQQNYSVKLQPLQNDSSITIKSMRKIKINSTYATSLNSEDLSVVTQEALTNASSVILKQYQRLSEQVQKSICLYDQQMKKNEQFLSKIQKYQAEQDQLMSTFSLQVQSDYQLTKDQRLAYQQKLKKFISFLKIIFTLLEYLQKKINYSSSHFYLSAKKTPQDQSSQNIKSFLDFNSRANTELNPKQLKSILGTEQFIPSNKNYISELHKNYYSLVCSEGDNISHSLRQIGENIYEDLSYDLSCWFQLLKQHFISGKNIKYPTLTKKQEVTHKKLRLRKESSKIIMRNNSMLQNKNDQKTQTEEQDIKMEERFNDQIYKRCHTTHREDGIGRSASYSKTSSISSSHAKFKAGNQSFHRKSAHNFGVNSIVNVSKLKNQEQMYKKAQRIQLLQDVDKDYYKMLKSTINMQKQNTRKNYEFMRTFKRAKYSSRDQILQQKRFESSYSMLFSNKRADTINIQNKDKGKKSAFYKAQQKQQKMKHRQSKLTNQVRKSLYSSQELKNSSQNLQELKQNIKRIKDKKQKGSDKMFHNKSRLSIKLKDVLNLV